MRDPKFTILAMFGRRMRALWEGKEGKEYTEAEFVDEMLIGGAVTRGVCPGCGDHRNVLNDFLCADCNARCVLKIGKIK